MELKNLQTMGLNSDTDFRSKATFGVALAGLSLLLPMALLTFLEGRVFIALGTLCIVTLLASNALLVYLGRCHQRLTLYILVPAGMSFLTTVFQYNGFIASLWCYPTIIACYCMLSERRAWVANGIILSFGLPMAAISLPSIYSVRVYATLLAISAFSAILVRVIDQLNRQLKHQLVHDPLTGLLNRLTLKDRLEKAIARHQKSGTAASLLAIDVDHFKRINDKHGHDVGDKALIVLAQILDTNLRDDDHAFRTGGEEFLVLLNGSSEKKMNIIAERLRRAIECASIVPDQAITISIGAAQLNQHENWTQWIKRADNHLLAAKRMGRNRVTIACRPQLVSVGHGGGTDSGAITRR